MNERCYHPGSSSAGCTEYDKPTSIASLVTAAVVPPSGCTNAMGGRELVNGQFPREPPRERCEYLASSAAQAPGARAAPAGGSPPVRYRHRHRQDRNVMPTDEWRAVRGSSRELPELGRRVEQKQVLSLGPRLALRRPQRCGIEKAPRDAWKRPTHDDADRP